MVKFVIYLMFIITPIEPVIRSVRFYVFVIIIKYYTLYTPFFNKYFWIELYYYLLLLLFPLLAGKLNKMPTVWSIRVVRGDQIFEGSWVGGSLPVFSNLLFSVLFISYERTNCSRCGWGLHRLCDLSSFFLCFSPFFFPLISFFVVDAP